MKKTLSMLLVLVMVLSMIPFAAFAAETVVIDSQTDLSLTVNSSGTAVPHTVEWTAPADGTITVDITSVSPGVKFWVGENYLPKRATAAATFEFEAVSGTAYDFEIIGYANWADTAATVSYTVTFTPAEDSGDEGGEEVVKADKIVSTTELALGDNTLTLDATAVTTIYAFEPSEVGTYSFTAPEGAIVGYWGAGTWFLSDPASTTNSCEWECTGVGQSAYIGVSNVEGEFTLTVAKTAEGEEQEQINYVDYVNQHTPSASWQSSCPSASELTEVDITESHSAVYGTDGYYHLDEADGPILYVDMITGEFDLTQAYYSDYGAMTMRGEVDGVRYDFLTAMRAYADVLYGTSGLYPLTVDLLTYIKGYGAYQGWFNTSLSPFAEITAGTSVAASQYLVLCSYVEPEPEQGDTADDPIIIIDDGSDDNDATITYSNAQKANKTVYYAAMRISGMVLTVKGEGDFTIEYNGKTYTSEDGVVEIENFSAASMWNPAVISITGDTACTYSMVIAAPLGDMMNPAKLNVTDDYANSATVAKGDQDGYYFTWTATADGDLVLTMADTNASGWQISVNNQTTYASTEAITSSGDVNSLTVSVAKGDLIQVVVNTYDAENPYTAPAGTVVFDAELVTEEEEPTVITLYDGDNDFNVGSYVYTATQTGTLYYTIDSYNYDYGYGMVEADWIDSDIEDGAITLTVNGTRVESATGSVEVTEGDEVTFAFSTTKDWTFDMNLNLSYEASGEEETVDPIWLYTSDCPYTTDAIEPGKTVPYVAYGWNGYNMTVTGEGAYVIVESYDYWTDSTVETRYDAVDGVVTVPMDSYWIDFKVGNDGDEAASFVIDCYAPEGTYNNPAELVMGENVAEIAQNGGYYYTWTADCNCELTISINTEKCDDWYIGYDLTLADGSYEWGPNSYSSGEGEYGLSTYTVSLGKGDTIDILVMTDSYLAGTVYLDASVEYNHAWDEGVTTPATCTKEGETVYTCSICGETKTEVIEKLAHTEVVDAAVAATCTTDGKTEGKHCSVCGEVIVAQETIKAAGHKWDEGKVTKEATCTAKGEKTYTCSECDETKTEEIAAAGHTYKDGKCTVCEAEDPNYEETNGSAQTGDTLIVAMTTVMILAAVAVVLLVMKKRRMA